MHVRNHTLIPNQWITLSRSCTSTVSFFSRNALKVDVAKLVLHMTLLVMFTAARRASCKSAVPRVPLIFVVKPSGFKS